MKSFLFRFLFFFFVSINLYSQFDTEKKEIIDPRFSQEESLLQKFPASFDPIMLDSLITSNMQTYHIPGIAALILKEDQIVWSKNYGFANIELNQSVKDSTMFLMASISKTFMATAVMQLWEDNLFELDDNINDYLQPDFQVVNPQYPNDTITIKMLLTHTSSIDDNWDILDPLVVCGDSPIPLDSMLINYFTASGIYYNPANFLAHSPNANIYHYTNIGSCLIAYLVEKLSGMPYDQYCFNNVLNPLGITEARWFLQGLDTSKIATPYDWPGSSLEALCHQGWPLFPIAFLRINKIELAQFLSSYMNWGKYNGNIILDSTTVCMMLSDQLGHLTSYGDYQGLIWYKPQVDGVWMWGHTGGWYGCNTAMFFDQVEKCGVIVFLNRDPSVPAFSDIVRAVCRYAHLYGNIYANNTYLDKSYMVPLIDTLTLVTEFENIHQRDFTASAIFISSDSLYIDSTALYDDGLHGDSLANDGIWGGFIHPLDNEEMYRVGISTIDIQTGKYFLINDLARFTTAGPIVIDSLEVVYHPASETYRVKPHIKNEGNSFTVEQLVISMQSVDSTVTYISGPLNIWNIIPGETIIPSNYYTVRVDSVFTGVFRFNFEMTSGGYFYWSNLVNYTVTEVENENNLPVDYKLYQNYPNPFNPVTMIRFDIPEMSRTTIRIYDIIGNEVATLVDEYKPAGSYEVEFATRSGDASGVYFYQLKAGNFIQTRKMILIK